ncbi:MAG: ABC transporter ATP-binding protein [Acidimicrobiales bacterium]
MSSTLSVRGLTAGYGTTTVLRGVDLEVDAGEVVCLLGRNGAGKTTLLRALMGLLPRRGRVCLGDRDVTHQRGSRISRLGMVWVPQESQVVPGLTVADHFALAVVDSDPARALTIAAETFPVLGERARQDAATLSGGERKMLGISLALAVEPSVILMDEPTEGVAPVVVQQLLSAMRSIGDDVAVLLVEQNLDTALALGERAYVLETGTIVESGPLDELSSSGRLESRLAL